MSETELGEDPELLKVPRAFVSEVGSGELDEDEVAQATLRLIVFVRGFFLRFLSSELGLNITGLDAQSRGSVSDFAMGLIGDQKRKGVLPLLYVFDDLCALQIEIGELSTPEEAGAHEAQIVKLTTRLLERIATWADLNDREDLGVEAARLAHAIKGLA